MSSTQKGPDKAAVKRAASNAKRSQHIQTRKKASDPKPNRINLKDVKLTEGQEKFVWEKADPVSATNPAIFRKDVAGAILKFNELGLESEFGWVYSLIDPEGENDDINNVVAMHWKNAKVKRKAGDMWIAPVTGAREHRDIYNYMKDVKITADALDKTKKTVLFQDTKVEPKKINVEIRKAPNGKK
ncbi:hypothetical protein SCLARK_001135 [Spiroplasma clarkii]|uniref:Uncharacterized protein n=1 Tax=Spiroplasma clarkii TaxID=2139 RepID=A0A1Y0L138_9MOLU|nr:hypothetical protein [Spiroplasma clarkii]ARU91696.1 hypothetical protein SCLARK_001135 [Spiroplasma clarkii]ATX71087.1 hypothetical protein SCLAR_v1c07720 [Spiroplasma clarkii]